jgi:hypothetical protein
MRRSNHRRVRIGLATAVAAALVAACGATAAPSPSATARPTPVITPDPHLDAPASVDDVFRLLQQAGIRITPNTASAGPGGEPVKSINATYADWPLVLTQFSTAEALVAAASFDPSTPPAVGDPPYVLIGMNIQVEYGPHTTNQRTPAPPSDLQQAAAAALVAALDPLIGPLTQRSVLPVPLPTLGPAPTPVASVIASPAGASPAP